MYEMPPGSAISLPEPCHIICISMSFKKTSHFVFLIQKKKFVNIGYILFKIGESYILFEVTFSYN